jgi:hypothetical protein
MCHWPFGLKRMHAYKGRSRCSREQWEGKAYADEFKVQLLKAYNDLQRAAELAKHRADFGNTPDGGQLAQKR